MESEHEMQGSGERGKKVEEMVKTWRGDVPGIFFAGLLAGWVGYVALQIAAGNTQLWRVFVGAAFFEGASRALQFFVQENPGFFRGLAPESRADFLNTCISLLHSTLMSLAGIVRCPPHGQSYEHCVTKLLLILYSYIDAEVESAWCSRASLRLDVRSLQALEHL